MHSAGRELILPRPVGVPVVNLLFSDVELTSVIPHSTVLDLKPTGLIHGTGVAGLFGMAESYLIPSCPRVSTVGGFAVRIV